MLFELESDGLKLAGQLARPERVPAQGTPGLVICHGFPTKSGFEDAGWAYYDLAERVAEELGWVALAFTYRGCGDSEGNFSLSGWLRDVHAASRHLAGVDGVDGVWLAGFGTGGALAIVTAAEDPDVRGVAAVAPPADFDDWRRDPQGLLAHARAVGAIRDPDFPPDPAAWADEIAAVSPHGAVSKLGDRPLLILHGGEDAVVPVFDARVLADEHGAADLRIIAGGGHRLRFDPRAVAVFLGWLDRAATETSAA